MNTPFDTLQLVLLGLDVVLQGGHQVFFCVQQVSHLAWETQKGSLREV